MAESYSHQRKLTRADLHIDSVEKLVSRWEKGGYRTSEESDSQGRSRLFAELRKPLPDDIALAIGDALHCQRASLDHIAFALAKRNKRTLTEDQEKKIEFPILDRPLTPKHWALRSMHWKVRPLICELAPDPRREALNKHPLWLLHKVENRDKHREIPLTVTAAHTAWTVTSSPSSLIERAPVELRPGAGPQLVCEYETADEIGIRVQILFDKGSECEGWPVLRFLRQLSDHIRDTVFDRLEPHLL